METVKIYLDLPADLQQLLEDNQISLPEILAQAGIEGTFMNELLPVQEDGARSKDVVLVIVAASAAVLAIGHALSQVISTLHRRPRLVEIYSLEEVRDANGDLIVDSFGRPIFKQQKKYELLEPQPANDQHALDLQANMRDGLIIRVRSDNQQIPQDRSKSAKQD